MRSRRTAAALALAVGTALIAAILIATTSSGGPTPAASAASTTTGTVAVRRRDLVATDTESGTVSYADPQTAYSRLTGTITWLPAVGQVIEPGQVLFRVDNTPAFLMNGGTPAFRDLSSADTPGPDVLELNRDLIALGDDGGGIVANDTWQAATTTGVEEFEDQRGLAVTGKLPLGSVVFLHGSRRITKQLGTVGTTGGGNGSSTPASLLDGPSRPEFVSLTKIHRGLPLHGREPRHAHSRRHARKTPTPAQQLQALLALLRSETAARGNSPASNSPASNSPKSSSRPRRPSRRSPSSPTSGGGGGGAGGNPISILDTTSSRIIITVNLAATSQGEARVGRRVLVQLPDTSTVPGRITAVSSVASSSNSDNSNNGNNGNGNNNGSPTVPVTIALSRRLNGAGLDQASVSVTFNQARRRGVLAVPVTALLATAGGGYALQEAAAPHRLIPVTTGLFAAGDVQVSGPGVHPGLVVTDSQG